MLLQLSGSTAVETDALREVILTVNVTVSVGTVVNIQTGANAGPATVAGDATTTLPPTGAEFAASGITAVFKNGQSLVRGAGLGFKEAQWISTTQLAFNKVLKPGDEIRVISPLPPP